MKPKLTLCHIGLFNLFVLLSGCGGGGGSTSTPTVDATTDTTTISAPSGLSLTPEDSQLSVNWNTVPNALQYNIYIAEGAFASKSTYSQRFTDNTPPYTINGLTNGQEYSVVVTALSDSAESTASNIANATPLAITSSNPFAVTSTTANHQISLEWTGITNATDYTIYRSLNPGVSATQSDAILYINTTSYTYTDLINDTTYYFLVVANDDAGIIATSAEISATPQLLSGWNALDEALGRYDAISTISTLSLLDNRDVMLTQDEAYDNDIFRVAFQESGVWGVPTQISSSSWQHAANYSENGDAIVAWIEHTYDVYNNISSSEIMVRHYQNQTWSNNTPLQQGTFADKPDVAIDGAGNAVTVWESDDDGHVYARAYTKATDTWAPVVQLSSTPYGFDQSPKVDVDDAGRFTIIWEEPSASYSNAFDLNSQQYTSANGWGVPLTLSAATANDVPVYGTDVVTGGNGDVFVTWWQSGLQLIIYRQSQKVWGTTQLVSDTISSVDEHWLDADDHGNVAIYWKSNDPAPASYGKIYGAVVYESDGIISPTWIFTDASNTIDRLVVVAANGAPQIIYSDNTGPEMFNHVYDYASHTWGTLQIIYQIAAGNDLLADSNANGEIAIAINPVTIDTTSYYPTVETGFYVP